MIPFLEGRAALPFALSSALLGSNVLPAWQALIFAFLGSVIPCFFVMFAMRKIKNRFFTGFIEERYSNKLRKLSFQNSNLKKLVLLASFVAIPLPMTGVWSGSVIAGISGLKLWQSFIAIAIGSLIACSIILGVCLLFDGAEIAILIISLVLLALFIIGELIEYFVKKKKSKIQK